MLQEILKTCDALTSEQLHEAIKRFPVEGMALVKDGKVVGLVTDLVMRDASTLVCEVTLFEKLTGCPHNWCDVTSWSDAHYKRLCLLCNQMRGSIEPRGDYAYQQLTWKDVP